MYYSDELYHHGIKGQRWGRRNGPPYPLSPQTHASVVRSAGRGGSAGSSRRGRIGGVNNEEEARRARRNKILKGVGVGLGAAALAGGAGYLAYRNRGAIANKARAVGNDIRDRAYIEKEIAKTRMNNLKGKANDLGGRMKADALIARGKAENAYTSAKGAINKGYNKALEKLPDKAQYAYGRAYYEVGEAANRAKQFGRNVAGSARSIPGHASNFAANAKDTISNTARRASTKAGVRSNQIFRGSKSMEAANNARKLFNRASSAEAAGRSALAANLRNEATSAAALSRSLARRRQLALGLGAGGVAALGGGTAAGISAYRRRKSRRRRR